MPSTGAMVKSGELQMIPCIDAKAMKAGDPETLREARRGAEDVGFLTLFNTALDASDVQATLKAYHAFFTSPDANKEAVDMSITGSNRGWGRPGSEQVDPNAHPDFKEVFDCGVEVPENDPQAHLSVYAPNLWPSEPAGFQSQIEQYLVGARDVALETLAGISAAIGADPTFFADKFDKPTALLRGNFYPERPDWATENDFGIAEHTDYGCLTLLATDGSPGLEVQLRDGRWIPISADPGTFIINFGEMLEIWTSGQVRATPHRVIGGSNERMSVPLFFNPNYDTNVAPKGAPAISAGDYLSKRYVETYQHLNKSA